MVLVDKKQHTYQQFQMHVILNLCMCMYNMPWDNCTPINKNVSLDDPLVIDSGKTWDWANFKKNPHDYSLTQVSKPVFSNLCVVFYISTCLHFLEMVINIQHGNPKPFIYARYDHKKTLPLFPLVFLNTSLSPTTLFLQRKIKVFCFQLQDRNKKNFKKGREKKRSYYSVHLEGMHLLNLYLWAQITFPSHTASQLFLCHFGDQSVLFIVFNHKNFTTIVAKWCFSCDCSFSLTGWSKLKK